MRRPHRLSTFLAATLTTLVVAMPGVAAAQDFELQEYVRFDPAAEAFTSFPLDAAGAAVRQLLGRPGEVWGAESALDRLVVVRATDSD